MASVTVRGSALCTVALLNFAFVFITGADFIRFLSFRAIYHNITGDTTLCQGKPPQLPTRLQWECGVSKSQAVFRVSAGCCDVASY